MCFITKLLYLHADFQSIKLTESVMIGQWKSEYISLSVRSVTRAVIAQWENKCISLSVLSVTQVMVAQWENECSSLLVLPVDRVQFSAMAEYFKGFFSGWSHSANPSWASVAKNWQHPLNGTTESVDIEEEGRSPTLDSQCLKESKRKGLMTPLASRSIGKSDEDPHLRHFMFPIPEHPLAV